MEQLPQMETGTIISGFILFGLFIMVLFVLSYYVAQYGKKNLAQEKEYDDLYRTIDVMINEMEVNRDSYLRIDLYYQQLKSLTWKNDEKTHVIGSKFFQKYAQIRIKNHLKL